MPLRRELERVNPGKKLIPRRSPTNIASKDLQLSVVGLNYIPIARLIASTARPTPISSATGRAHWPALAKC